MIKRTEHPDDELLIMGDIAEPDSVEILKVGAWGPAPRGKVAPTKPKKNNNAQKTPQKSKKKGRKRR